MAIGDEEILPAVVVVVEKKGSPTHKGAAAAGQTGSAANIAEEAVALVAVEGVVVLGEIGDENIGAQVIVDVAQCHAHPGLGAPVAAVGRARGQRDIGKATTVVAPQAVGVPVVGDVEVGVAIRIEIEPGCAHAVEARAAEARFMAHFREGAVALVAIEQIALGFGTCGAAGGGHAIMGAPAIEEGRAA